MTDNKYFELFKNAILQDNLGEIKNLLREESFNRLNNEEKTNLLTLENEDGKSILTLAIEHSLNSLSILLNSRAFFDLNQEQFFKILNYSNSFNNMRLIDLATIKTPKEIHTILDSRMVNKLHIENLFNLLSKDQNNEAPLNQAIKISIENMSAILNSIALEKLGSEYLLKFLTGDDYIDSPIALAMRKSSEHMKIFLDSKAIERLDSSSVFEFLNTIIDDVESVNIIWSTIIRFDLSYLSILLNSKIFDKISSEQAGKLLSTVYEENHDDLPLNYLLKFRELPFIECFLNSTAFNKLGKTEIEKQFETCDINKHKIFDMVLAKKPESLGLFLDCNNCLKTLPDEEKIDVLTNRSIGIDHSPLGTMMIDNGDSLIVLFSSETLSNMDNAHLIMLTSLMYNNNLVGGTNMHQITHNPEKLIAFINTKAFIRLPQEEQSHLIGENLLLNVKSFLLPEVDAHHYNMTCVGQVIQENDA